MFALLIHALTPDIINQAGLSLSIQGQLVLMRRQNHELVCLLIQVVG